jgi:hypothetical protein
VYDGKGQPDKEINWKAKARQDRNWLGLTAKGSRKEYYLYYCNHLIGADIYRKLAIMKINNIR